MRSVSLPAFAKINLCLHVLGKRADGYHELRTVFQTISLHDTLRLTLTRHPGISLETDNPALPSGRENLVWRALDALRRELRLCRRELPAARLVKLAASLGADVPFFLFGGRALGIGRGDEVYPLPDLPGRAIIVVSPRDVGISTREAYRWVSRRLTMRKQVPKLHGFCALCWSLQGGVSNDFEAVIFRRYPRLAKLKQGLLRRGALEAALAGSGSAVFGVFRNPAQARRSARAFPKDQVFGCKTLSRGEYRRAERGRGGV